MRLTKQVGRTVNYYYRRAMGFTTKQLAELCTILAKGGDKNAEVRPTTLNNLFAGKRKTISYGEIVLFARALQLPPVALMTPIGVEDRSEYWPTFRATADLAFDAIVGIGKWSLIDHGDSAQAWETSQAPEVERAHRLVDLLLEHGTVLRDLSNAASTFLFENPEASGFSVESAVAAARRQGAKLRQIRIRLADFNVPVQKLTPLVDWVDVIDAGDFEDPEFRALLERSARAMKDTTRVVFVRDDDGAPTNAD